MARQKALVVTDVEVPDSRDDELELDPQTAGLNALHRTNRLLSAQLQAREKSLMDLLALMTGNYTDMVELRRGDQQLMREHEKVHLENLKLHEDLLDRRDERKRKRDREKSRDEFTGEIVGDIRALLPKLVNGISGRPVLSEPEAATLKPVVESLSQDQLGKILDVLTQPQRVAFLALLDAIPPEPRGKMNGSGAAPSSSSEDTETDEAN